MDRNYWAEHIARPNRFAPRAAVTRFAKALMDDPLLDAFGYRRPAACHLPLPHPNDIDATLMSL